MSQSELNKSKLNLQSFSTKMPDRQEMYQALVNKDLSYEGVFIAAIKTTGIFCRSSCYARKPKEENVEYYSNCTEAISFGYRACKVCKPLEPLGETPAWISDLLIEVANDPNKRIKDYELREKGLEPATLRRWFNKHHGMTFQSYLRALRLNQAIGRIKYESPVTKAAFESGYDSLSGFGDAFKKLLGVSPKQSQSQTLVTITRVLTPLGPMVAGATDKGICLLEFTDRKMLETQLKRLSKLLNARFVPGQHHLFSLLEQQLNRYFKGELKAFDLPLDIPGTDFQQSVWCALMKIPFGKTRSYQEQAQSIENPKAVRAVAKANGDNRISIIVPCHRVIGKNGTLTGYGGGLWRKQRLLEIELSSV
jgi:AraC family transcriptional regulator of adaptative response/methylated-DNA-[protein]-cysteine methyltransferase